MAIGGKAAPATEGSDEPRSGKKGGTNGVAGAASNLPQFRSSPGYAAARRLLPLAVDIETREHTEVAVQRPQWSYEQTVTVVVVVLGTILVVLPILLGALGVIHPVP